MILFGCNNSTSDKSKNVSDSEEKTAEEIGKAVLHTSLTDVSPISVEELETTFPISGTVNMKCSKR